MQVKEIQRDIDDIRNYLEPEEKEAQNVIYDRTAKGYKSGTDLSFKIPNPERS